MLVPEDFWQSELYLMPTFAKKNILGAFYIWVRFMFECVLNLSAFYIWVCFIFECVLYLSAFYIWVHWHKPTCLPIRTCNLCTFEALAIFISEFRVFLKSNMMIVNSLQGKSSKLNETFPFVNTFSHPPTSDSNYTNDLSCSKAAQHFTCCCIPKDICCPY